MPNSIPMSTTKWAMAATAAAATTLITDLFECSVCAMASAITAISVVMVQRRRRDQSSLSAAVSADGERELAARLHTQRATQAEDEDTDRP